MFSKKEIIDILSDPKSSTELYQTADRIRKEYVGDGVHLRGLIEFSNICRCSCKYCGIRLQNKGAERYRFSSDEIVENARKAVDSGFKTIVLQSGEDSFFSCEIMCDIIKRIKETGAALTLSIGERPKDDYKAFFDAGADRYLIRIETTDKKLYEKMHPGMDFNNRIRCLKDLKEIGFETGSGCLVGLPFQSVESLALDILFFVENDFDMIGIGPFIPHPDTPLFKENAGDLDMSLKVMALTRIMLKNINIPATTAMETINPNGRILALKAGANVIMPNVSAKFKERYEIYPNKASFDGKGADNILKQIGRYVSSGYGFRRDNFRACRGRNRRTNA